MTDKFIPPHGGYQSLLSYQRAEVVYDATVKFCADLLDKRDRTVDQMIHLIALNGLSTRVALATAAESL